MPAALQTGRMIYAPRWFKRRWLRYNLATMLAVVALLCANLAHVANRAHRQRDAVAALRDHSTFILYEDQLSRLESIAYHRPENLPGPKWLRDWAGIDFAGDVTRVFAGNVIGNPVFDDLPMTAMLQGAILPVNEA